MRANIYKLYSTRFGNKPPRKFCISNIRYHFYISYNGIFEGIYRK